VRRLALLELPAAGVAEKFKTEKGKTEGNWEA